MKLRLLCEDQFFDYSSIAKDTWGKKLQEAQKEQGIHFATENDDDVSQRSVKIDQDMWDFTDCRFRCELRYAGGDWEWPVAYFRVQIVDGYADGVSQYGNPYFVVIPDKNGGNHHLVKAKSNEWCAPNHENTRKKTKDEMRPQERKCWAFLKKYLTDMVQKEVKKVRKGRKHPATQSDRG
jgi:hypothetical protein